MPDIIQSHSLIVDFEATCCDAGTVPRGQMEIIEFGAVMMRNADFQVIDEFQSFVRPVRHPVLTDFCRGLTSIRQTDVDSAPGFPEAAEEFRKWLHQYQDFLFCSWGDYDKRQLAQDCAYHDISDPVGAPHLNVKRAMAEKQALPRQPGLGQAIKLAGLTFQGTAHRGIDDARNIARLTPWIIGDEKLPN